MKYQSHIDGLRAIAVLVVIFFHAGFSGFSGGYVGVDVFFVISGYLITALIYKQLCIGKFSVKSFYVKRIRRILPALYVVILCTIPFAWYLLQAEAIAEYGESMSAVVLLHANIYFYDAIDYWNTASELQPLLHTWSLAVEEQYYMFFPLLCILAFRVRSRQLVLPVIVVLSVVSFAIGQLTLCSDSAAAFYLLPSRAWEMGLGSIAALLCARYPDRLERLRRRYRESLSLLGLAMIFYSVFAFSKETVHPSYAALIPTIGAVFVVVFGNEATIVHRLLSMKLLVGIGLVSYSAYLWHQPLFAFARQVYLPEPAPSIFVALILGTFALSYVTWRFVEAPFRQSERISNRTVIIWAVVASLFIGVTGYTLKEGEGFPERRALSYLEVGGYEADNKKLQQESWVPLRELSGYRRYGVKENPFDEKLWPNPTGKERVLLVGNSHSKDLLNVILHSKYRDSHDWSRYGVNLGDLVNTEHAIYRSENYRAANVIFICTRFKEGEIELLPDIITGMLNTGKRVIVAEAGYEFTYTNNFTLADVEIRKYIFGKRSQSLQDLSKAINSMYYNEYIEHSTRRKESRVHSLDQALSSFDGRVSRVDRIDLMVDVAQASCMIVDEHLTKHLYDYGHYTIAGARYFGRKATEIGWLDQVLAVEKNK